MFLTLEEATGGEAGGLIDPEARAVLLDRLRARHKRVGRRYDARSAARYLGRRVRCSECGWEGHARCTKERRLRTMVCPSCAGWRIEAPASIENPRLWQARHPDGRGTLYAVKRPPSARRR